MERLTEDASDGDASDHGTLTDSLAGDLAGSLTCSASGPRPTWPWTTPQALPRAAAGAASIAPPGPGPAGLDRLARTIEAEIIPRLLLAHRVPPGESAPASPLAIDDAMVERYCDALLGGDPGEPVRQLRAFIDARVPTERLLLDLLAPAARRLGALWEVDLCDFASVTLGLWRLQQALHEVSGGLRGHRDVLPASRHSVLLTAAPESQHTFGLLMVAEFFQQAGWDVEADPCLEAQDLLQRLRRRWVDVLGFSLGSECHVQPLASVILAARQASRNRALKVMVGGPVLLACPDLVTVLGADATAVDAPSAVRRAEQLVLARQARPH